MLRSDPFETADREGMDYERWRTEHVFVLVRAQQYVGKFLATFQEFPPSQKPGSFSIDRALESLQSGAQGGKPIGCRAAGQRTQAWGRRVGARGFISGVRRCAIHGVTALGKPSRVGDMPH